MKKDPGPFGRVEVLQYPLTYNVRGGIHRNEAEEMNKYQIWKDLPWVLSPAIDKGKKLLKKLEI